MLSRAIAIAAVTAAALAPLAVTPGASPADSGAECPTTYNPNTGTFTLGCSTAGSTGGSTTGDGSTSSSGGGSTVVSKCYVGEFEIPCTIDGSWWSSTHGCYIGPVVPPGNPWYNRPPPGGQTAEDGAWHQCYYPYEPGPHPHVWSNYNPVWIPNGSETADPAQVAHRAVISMKLDPIKIGIVPKSAPGSIGLVGLPVWMWADNPTPATYGPITATATDGPLTVTATGKVTSITWDMADGNKITCTNPGTPYEPRYNTSDSPTCGHRYEKQSTTQPQGAYQITATSHWLIEWSGGGQTGTITLGQTTKPLPIRIGEAQVLNQ
jgi:hypothetical protein